MQKIVETMKLLEFKFSNDNEDQIKYIYLWLSVKTSLLFMVVKASNENMEKERCKLKL